MDANEKSTARVSHVPHPADIHIKKGLRNHSIAAFFAEAVFPVNFLAILNISKVAAISEIKRGILNIELKRTPGT